MKKICFFSGDIRSGGTERVSTVIANQLVKNKKFDICFLSLWENNDKLFYTLNDKIKKYTLFEKVTSGKRILTYLSRRSPSYSYSTSNVSFCISLILIFQQVCIFAVQNVNHEKFYYSPPLYNKTIRE